MPSVGEILMLFGVGVKTGVGEAGISVGVKVAVSSMTMVGVSVGV